MDIVKLSIERPVTVTVGVILVVMFGLIGLRAIPIQLTPTVDRPIITVTTNWPGRSPEEIVDEITKEQEERLKNVGNLDKMQSVSREGTCEITLEFILGSDISRALQEVSDALRQVPGYPEEVDEPTIKAAEGASENAIAWMIFDVDPEFSERFPDFDITTLQEPIEDEIKPYLERIDGVAEINIFGGREREVRVNVDPLKLAQRQLTHADVVQALRQENRNVSAGSIPEGKRDYRVRLVGQFETTAEMEQTIVAYRDGKPVYLKDVATVELGYSRRRGYVRSFGAPCLAMNCIRQSGANVMSVMEALRNRLEEVREDILPNLPAAVGHPEVGQHMRLRQVYDETIYIDSAIELVLQNLWFGGILAAIVLFAFLRSFMPTFVIFLAIPISVIGTFLVLLALGRSLNVISLAGLAFAVGMVVDNAIVVLENIYRRLQEGEDPREAAWKGGREVWGAILASTLTTVAVFIPMLTIEEEAGQLFRDISLAIVGAVCLSLLVSITVIPTACAAWLRRPKKRGGIFALAGNLLGLVPLLGAATRGFGRLITWLSSGWRGFTLRPLVIVLITYASIMASLALMPPLDYLPAGNRNLVFGGLLIPPGYSIEQQTGIARRIEAEIIDYAEANIDDAEAVAALPPIPRREAPEEPFAAVPIDNFFIGAFPGRMFVGATSEDPTVVIPIGTLLTNSMNKVPDAFGGARQASIFGRGVGGGNQINLEVSGPRLDRVIDAAGMMFGIAAGKYGYGNVRPNPSNFNLAQPEWRLRLNRRGRELGLTNAGLAAAVRGFFDGAFAGEFRYGADTIDIAVLPEGGRLDYKERLAELPIVTPSGRVVPVDQVIEIIPSLAPQEIQRVEELPTVTVQIVPPQGAALELIMQEVQAEVVGPVRAAGLIDSTMRVRLEGTAAQLDEVKGALFGRAAESEDAAEPTKDEPTEREPTEAGKASVPELPRRSMGKWIGIPILLIGILAAAFVALQSARKRELTMLYGSAGALLLGLGLAALSATALDAPHLANARFVWALLVTYLLMCSLFESFLYPLVIMFSVPLAVVGGFAGLRIVHDHTMADPTIAPQQLDVLTMLGFAILIGVVVNNAILIVHQALNFMSDPDLTPLDAVGRSVQTRIRPIFISTLTSVGGMLPLVLMPGAGSEMYRGLGSVVVGGLLVSTFFTLILVPLFFTLMLQMRDGMRRAFG